MTTYLLATSSVHVTAAAADYLEGRLDPDTDSLVIVGIREPSAPGRDLDDAANVARSRLAHAMPDVELRDGDPVEELQAANDDHQPDVLVIGPHDGTEGSTGLGTTAAVLLETVEIPVVVVPLPELE